MKVALLSLLLTILTVSHGIVTPGSRLGSGLAASRGNRHDRLLYSWIGGLAMDPEMHVPQALRQGSQRSAVIQIKLLQGLQLPQTLREGSQRSASQIKHLQGLQLPQALRQGGQRGAQNIGDQYRG